MPIYTLTAKSFIITHNQGVIITLWRNKPLTELTDVNSRVVCCRQIRGGLSDSRKTGYD